MFDAGQLRAATFVRSVEIHDTLRSTNDHAAALASEAAIELPALVVARRQTAGRGRGRNAWWSADGALTFSLIVDEATTGVGQGGWPRLSLAVAVAVCDALRLELSHADNLQSAARLSSPKSIRNPQSNLCLGIKWPNDVLLDGGKVAGILIESPGGSAPAKERLVIGIGINVNNSWRGAAREAGLSGTALCDVTGRQHDLQRALRGVLNHLANRIMQLRDQNMDLIRDWQRLDLLAGKNIIVDRDGQRIEGRALEIASDGALVVETLFGQQRFYSGSVRVD